MGDVCFRKKKTRGFPTLGSAASCGILGKKQVKICPTLKAPHLSDGCRMEGNSDVFNIVNKNCSLILFRDALRNSFDSKDPHFSRHIQHFAKTETSFGWFPKPRQQHNQLLQYEQLKARHGVAMYPNHCFFLEN